MDYNTGRYRKALKVWGALQNMDLTDKKKEKWEKYKDELERAYTDGTEQEFAAAVGRFGIPYIPKRKNVIFSKPFVENYPLKEFGRDDDGKPFDKMIEFRFGGNNSTNRPSKIFKYEELVEARQIVYDFRNSDAGGRTWGVKVGYTQRCWYEDVYCVLTGINKPGVPIWTGNPTIGKMYRKYTGRDWVTGIYV